MRPGQFCPRWDKNDPTRHNWSERRGSNPHTRRYSLPAWKAGGWPIILHSQIVIWLICRPISKCIGKFILIYIFYKTTMRTINFYFYRPISFSMLLCSFTTKATIATGFCDIAITYWHNLPLKNWWRIRATIPLPPACKAGALPIELIPRNSTFTRFRTYTTQ